MNTFKKEEKKVKQKQTTKFSRSLINFFSGSFLTKEKAINQLPFAFFLTFLGVLYIANGYYAEQKVREISKVGTELKELRSEYITIKSDLNFKSKQSQIVLETEKFGVKESVSPPEKIIVSKKEMQTINNDEE